MNSAGVSRVIVAKIPAEWSDGSRMIGGEVFLFQHTPSPTFCRTVVGFILVFSEVSSLSREEVVHSSTSEPMFQVRTRNHSVQWLFVRTTHSISFTCRLSGVYGDRERHEPQAYAFLDSGDKSLDIVCFL